MRLAAVVIWYNPDVTEVRNLKTYISHVEQLYVIDNSDNSNKVLLEELENVTYIANFKNKGIAAAQNIGCRKAFEDGFEWCLMMDQDSYWDSHQLTSYIGIVSSYIERGYFSFGIKTSSNDVPVSYYQDFKNLIKKLIHYKSVLSEGNESLNHERDVEYVSVLIASGNIFSLTHWNEIGGFRESFFIDEVDHAFSLDLQRKYNKALVKFNGIMMNHTLGQPHKSLFPRDDFHTGIRLYYMVRNTYYITDEYPEFENQYHRRNLYKRIFFQNLRDLKIKNIVYMIRGYRAYKKGIIGVYS